MASKSKDMVKGIVKNPAPKSTYGTDPNDPWSTKLGITENITSRRSDLLKKFYKAKGYNINYISKNQRVGQAKTGEFDKWKADHGIYEEDSEQIDELNKDTLYSYASKANKNLDAKHRELGPKIKSNDAPAANKISNTIKNRMAGLDRADDRLQKEARMSAAEKLSRAFDKQRAKSDASLRRTPSSIPKKEVAEETDAISVKQIRSQTADSPTHKRMNQLNKAAQIGTIKTVHAPAENGLRKEDNINDPQCATQSPFDGANTPDDVAPKKTTKASKMVKEIYAKHRLKEDLYDHEKDDKGPGTYGKPPKVNKKVEVNDNDEKGVNARMVLKGGTTLTGEKRDTIEIDPMLKNRSKTADYLTQDPKKEQLRTK